TNWDTAKGSNVDRFKRFFHHMLERGIYLPPSQFEAAFLSSAHSTGDIERTVAAMDEFFAST
ncbi:MAG: aspartate aminotransferase family protein, partial [Bryobacteraceae bacterium]